MQVQFNTNESVDGHEALANHARTVVRKALSHVSDQITRVEIHVTDVNGHKVGERDKHCLMEARIAGRQPIAVNEQADSVHQAIDGAAQKLRRAMETVVGKATAKRRSTPVVALPAEVDAVDGETDADLPQA